jgi:hypothetical protein
MAVLLEHEKRVVEMVKRIEELGPVKSNMTDVVKQVLRGNLISERDEGRERNSI